MPSSRALTSTDESDHSEDPRQNITSSRKRKGETETDDAEKRLKTAVGEASEEDSAAGNGQSQTIRKSSKRASEVASNVVEKGIIFFVTRGRVGVEEVDQVGDLQRTYIILRPLPRDAQLGEGAIPDEPVARLIAIPKKTLPKSQQERFMVFVESSGKTMADLRDEFFKGSEYETKTMGTRKTPPITIVGEGVYAITNMNKASHLAYILAIPSEPGELQKDLGVQGKGSFVISLKNPTIKGPQNAQLAESPDFPKAILDEFEGYRWISVQKPEHMDYPNAQLLLIGHGKGEFGDALKENHTTAKGSTEKSAEEELEKLEGEEEIRIEHLNGEDSIFDDLKVSSKGFELKSSWFEM